jgi:cytochrome c biogenesis protein CcmG, thiol:disulfide interchange protein DsbE
MTTHPLERPLPQTQAAPQRPWWVAPALLVALSVLALLAYGLFNTNRAQVVGGPAPDFTLQTFDGETVSLSDLRGKPVVVNFWASWCLECDEEMALLEATHQKYKDEVVFIGVDYTDTDAKAREYLAQYGITYLNGPDLGSRISDDYRIQGVPETFFIDENGTVVGMHKAALNEVQLEGWLAMLREDDGP